jgi:peptidoglycan/xylan/chitin deacetylase (PgdA/CDA1 family)
MLRRLLFCAAALSALPGHAAVTTDEEHEHIRKHHLNRLVDKLISDPKELEASCKYESEIATPPPLNRVALTFDDGPAPGATEEILVLLQKYHISATFFMVGKKAEQYPELVAKVRAAQHSVIANHSWDHPNFHDISAAEQSNEVLRNEQVLAADLQPKLFRYPYGNSSCETNALVRARGYRIVGWHIDSCDWAYDKTGTVDAKEALSCGVPAQYRSDYVGHVVAAARAHKGGIILMHEIHPNTLKQLEAVIVQLQAEGFVFGNVQDAEFASSLR